MSDDSESLYLGLDSNCVPDLETHLNQAIQTAYDFVTVPLVHPRFRRNLTLAKEEREWPLTRSDLTFNSSTWSSQVVAKVSPWLDLDSSNSTIRRNSELVCTSLFTMQHGLIVVRVDLQARGRMGNSPLAYVAWPPAFAYLFL